MYKFLLISFFCFFSFIGNGFAQSSKTIETLNGTDWIKWKKETKVAFVTGFISGSEWMAINSLFPKSLFPNEQSFSKAEIIWNKVTEESGKAISDPKTSLSKFNALEVLLFSMYDAYKKNDLFNRAIIRVSNTDIVEGLEQFYNNSKNSQVLISNAIYLICKKLKGAPKEDIDELLPYLRGEKEIPLGWIIPVYDKNGKFIRIIEFP